MSKNTEYDDIFSKPQRASDFKFGATVVKVFDDMVTRSVPFYLEIQRMMTEIAADFAVPGTNVYDLGCSTGTTLLNIDKVLPPEVNFIGIDNSEEMLAKCKGNFETSGVKRNYELRWADLNKGIEIENASVVVVCLTLQFIRPLYREKLMKDIYAQMNENS